MKHILISNDDGFDSIGILSLYKELKKKYRVTVCAPECEMSGASHSFTFKSGLSYRKVRVEGADNAFYSVSGKPSDCVKFALGYILYEDMPDAIISGINHGLNTGIASYYSGTVAVAREGAFWRIPSISFSICEGNINYMDMYSKICREITETYLLNIRSDDLMYFNVNFPKCRPKDIKGHKLTRQSLSYYKDLYTEASEKFVLTSSRELVEEDVNYDIYAVDRGYVSITPMCIDNTCNTYFENLCGEVYGE